MYIVALCDPARGVGASVGSETGVIQSVVNDRDARRRHAEESRDVVRGLAADRDNLVLPMRELADDDAAVGHAQ